MSVGAVAKSIELLSWNIRDQINLGVAIDAVLSLSIHLQY